MGLLIQHVRNHNPGETEKEEGGQEPWLLDDDSAKVESQHRMKWKPDVADPDLPSPEYQAFHGIAHHIRGVSLNRHYFIDQRSENTHLEDLNYVRVCKILQNLSRFCCSLHLTSSSWGPSVQNFVTRCVFHCWEQISAVPWTGNAPASRYLLISSISNLIRIVIVPSSSPRSVKFDDGYNLYVNV